MQTAMSQGPLERSTLTSDLAAAVVRMVGERGLEPGMKLDSQRELAAHFGVAVPTMREALRRLEGLGMLSFRHGSGIYVGPNVNRSVVPNGVLPPADRERLVELVAARALIEPAIAERAAEVRDPEGIARLEAVLEEARQGLEAGADTLWRTNIDLHRAIAAAAGNRIVAEVLDSLLLIHAEDQRKILALHGDPETDYAEHAEIVRLIVAGRTREVTQVMRRHLTDVAGAISAPTPPPTG